MHRLANDKAPVEEMIADPVERLKALTPKRNPRIPMPEDIFLAGAIHAGLLLADPVAANR